jgi:hypothetical protein
MAARLVRFPCVRIRAASYARIEYLSERALLCSSRCARAPAKSSSRLCRGGRVGWSVSCRRDDPRPRPQFTSDRNGTASSVLGVHCSSSPGTQSRRIAHGGRDALVSGGSVSHRRDDPRSRPQLASDRDGTASSMLSVRCLTAFDTQNRRIAHGGRDGRVSGGRCHTAATIPDHDRNSHPIGMGPQLTCLAHLVYVVRTVGTGLGQLCRGRHWGSTVSATTNVAPSDRVRVAQDFDQRARRTLFCKYPSTYGTAK